VPYSGLKQSDVLREKAKVEPLFLLGGAVLTFIAGFINTTSLMYFHVPVSHMTGVVTKMSIDLASLQIRELMSLLYIFAGFFGGAVVSGFVIGAGDFSPKRAYSFILLLEAACLVLALTLFQNEFNLGLAFVAFACGLQNAMASTFLGLIVRTTHVTGIVTDLGVLVGQAMKHRSVKRWKFFFLSTLLGGFFAGGVIAMLAFGAYGFYALLVPTGLCAACAAAFYWVRVNPVFKLFIRRV
jgi:uncharacterized membrane protein YoaK (UPF0700 family)